MILRILLKDHKIHIWYGDSNGKFTRFDVVIYTDSVYNELLEQIPDKSVQTFDSAIQITNRSIFYG